MTFPSEKSEATIDGLAYSLGALRPIADLEDGGVPADTLEILAAAGLETYSAAEGSVIDLAVASLRKTIERARVDPAEVDALLFASEDLSVDGTQPVGMRGQLYQMMHGLGLRRAFPLACTFGGCSNFASAVSIASDMVRFERAKQVLVVGADKSSGARSRVIPPAVGVVSDGAASCVVRGETPEMTSGAFAIEAIVQHAELSLHDADLSDDFGRYLIELGRALKAMAARITASTGRAPSEYELLVLNNYSRSTTRVFAHALGFQGKQLYSENVGRYSHVASSDTAINLATLLEGGRLTAGDRVMACASGPLSWCMLALRKT
jgi:3-oxoacyl-[acyl-carrier-protein] synthase III